MKVLLINPPYQTITSNFGVGHQVPLGLLMVGGPLIDAGHEVRLLDAECRRLSLVTIVREVRRWGPDVVMTGHAGSTPAHPVCVRMLRAIKARAPGVVTVYGGVYPTYHAERILAEEPAVDLIVRGEGEATALDLVRALESGGLTSASTWRLSPVSPTGTAGRWSSPTPDRRSRTSTRWRVGWELIERWDDYRCFGLGRAAVVQFSRGCPHRCTYCGQHGFWVKWRHRDPARLADEVEWLHRTHGVNFVTLADENPTTLKDQWRSFLEEMRDRRLPVHFFATIRAIGHRPRPRHPRSRRDPFDVASPLADHITHCSSRASQLGQRPVPGEPDPARVDGARDLGIDHLGAVGRLAEREVRRRVRGRPGRRSGTSRVAAERRSGAGGRARRRSSRAPRRCRRRRRRARGSTSTASSSSA